DRSLALRTADPDALLTKPFDLRNQATTLRRRATVLAHMGRMDEALRSFDDALEFQKGIDRLPTLVERAKAQARSGDHAAAALAAEQLFEEMPKPSPNAASWLAGLFATLATTDPDPAAAEKYAIRSVEYIRQGIARGLSRSVIEQDDDIAPL